MTEKYLSPNLEQTASYIIYTDGNTYYALNGETGEINYSGTDAITVIQNVLDNTSGTVYMKNGLYLLNKAIEIKNNGTILIGEGENTILKRADVVESALSSDASSGQKNVVVSDASSFMVGQQVFIGQKSSTDDTWEINRIASISGNTLTMKFNLVNSYAVADGDVVYTTYHVIEAFSKSNIAIKNLYIDGNKANNYYYSQYDTSITADYYEDDGALRAATFLVQNGVYLEKCNHSLIEGVHAKNNVGWGGITLYKTTHSVVENCWTEYGIRHGIIVYSNSYRNLIRSCYSNNNGDTGETFPRHNYIIEHHCDETSITNCVGSNPTRNNIYIFDTSYHTFSGNFLSTDDVTNYIYMTGTCEYIDVSNNIFYSYGSNTNLGRINTADTCDYLSFSNNLFYTPDTDDDVNHLVIRADHSIINGNMFFNGRWGVYLAGVTDVTVSNNIFYDCATGIEARTSGDDTVDRCLVIGNHIYNATSYGIEFYHGGNDNDIVNNYIYSSGDRAIYTGSSTNHGSISNNYIISCSKGIQVVTSDVVIKDNILRDIAVFVIYNDDGNAVIKDNIGYTTENSGTAIFSGNGSKTSFNIPHGLAAIPSNVRVSSASPDAEGVYSSRYDANAANIVAKFKTAPPSPTVEDSNSGTISGTSNTISDDGKSWTNDEWIGHYVRITGGTGDEQCRRIIDNDATTLTVSPDWDTIPDNTSTYDIIDSAIEIEWEAEV